MEVFLKRKVLEKTTRGRGPVKRRTEGNGMGVRVMEDRGPRAIMGEEMASGLRRKD